MSAAEAPKHQIKIPYNFELRDYQRRAWAHLEAGVKRMVLVWHRRAGKDLMSLAWTVRQALTQPGLYWIVLPTFKMARRIHWQGRRGDGIRFMDMIPPELVARKREDEMAVFLTNGSIIQFISATDPDSLIGANPIGVCFSEYAIMDTAVWDLVRPILAENGGWAIFISTPRGHNHLYDLHRMAKKHEAWYTELLTYKDTGAISDADVQAEIDAGMPIDVAAQEFECSFKAAAEGAYYSEEMKYLDEHNRITLVPWEKKRPVRTGWDLGIGDSTAIWFHQRVGHENRLIDFYQSQGVGIEHYIKKLREKPYDYIEHLVPHDADAKELGTGRTLVETAEGLGFELTVVPLMSLADGIQAVRGFLPSCWIDEKACERGIEALRQYRRKKILGSDDFSNNPHHDKHSHPADALRTLACGMPDFDDSWDSSRVLKQRRLAIV